MLSLLLLLLVLGLLYLTLLSPLLLPIRPGIVVTLLLLLSVLFLGSLCLILERLTTISVVGSEV